MAELGSMGNVGQLWENRDLWKMLDNSDRIGIYERTLNKLGNYSIHRRFLEQSQQLIRQSRKFFRIKSECQKIEGLNIGAMV